MPGLWPTISTVGAWAWRRAWAHEVGAGVVEAAEVMRLGPGREGRSHGLESLDGAQRGGDKRLFRLRVGGGPLAHAGGRSTASGVQGAVVVVERRVGPV